jgi:hypothetical protein
MPAQLSYVPVVEHAIDQPDYLDESKELARQFYENEVPVCYIRRMSGADIERASIVSPVFNKKGVLTVVELHGSDPVLSFRNLAEWAVCGTVALIWEDGEPAFDKDAMLNLIDGAGRHRLVLDIILRFQGGLPDEKKYKSMVKAVGAWTKKYSHTQSIKIDVVPDGFDEEQLKQVLEYARFNLEYSRWSLPSIAPSLWVKYPQLREFASDLGLVVIDPNADDPIDSALVATEMREVVKMANELAVPVVPRLPLIPRFYSKGWYAFEVGKTLDLWTDRRDFRRYRDRPGWLEDPR